MRILFITSNRVGDAILSTVVLRALLRRYKNARITIACGPAAAPLFKGVPGTPRILPMAKKPWGAHWLALWAATAPVRWDIVVDLRASAIAWCLIAKTRLVYQTPKSYLHRVESLGRFIGNMVSPKIWLTPDAEAAAAALLPAGPAPLLALGPTANWVGKQWPVERFVELTARLTAPGAPFHGATVMVLGGPGERAAAEPLIASLPPERCIDLVGKADLLTIAACLKQARLYIGNDSGLMHLAATMGAPTLGLFGPSQETHYAPFGPQAATIRGEAYADLFAAAQRDRAKRPPRVRCHMMGLSVDMVHGAALDLYRRGQEAGSKTGGVDAEPPLEADVRA